MRNAGKRSRLILPPLQLLKLVATVAVMLTTTALASGEPVPEPANLRLTNDVPAGRALFDVRNAGPGDRPVRRCIVLRNSGDRPVRVSMRLARPPIDRGLGAYVQMMVERGSQPWATPGVDCRRFRAVRRGAAFFRGPLDAFPTTRLDAVADGAPVLLPERRRAYRISWWLSDSLRDQSGSISGVDFVWEVNARAVVLAAEQEPSKPAKASAGRSETPTGAQLGFARRLTGAR